MKLWLITPPMTQISTPYPATAYLKGFLREHSPETVVTQFDWSLELALKIFSREGLKEIAKQIPENHPEPFVQFFKENIKDYISAIDQVIAFLQGRDSTLAYRLAKRTLVPEGPRFAPVNENPELLANSFGQLGIQDQAKHIASLFLDDIVDVVRNAIDPDFQFSKYGEKLAASAKSFDPLHSRLHSKKITLIENWIEEITVRAIQKHGAPEMVCLTVPFPGNVPAALRIAKVFKSYSPETQVCLGGGFVNTELRSLTEPRLFEFIDFITMDDGERPLLQLIERIKARNTSTPLLRTKMLLGGVVTEVSSAILHDIPFKNAGTPDYEGLKLSEYISMLEMLNPMHRMWSDLRWNKMTLAHGCYWKKCSFCDVSLDYISRFEPVAADRIIDQMQTIASQTGSTGFHFVDEAAPPALLKQISQRLIERGLKFSWWGNLRFDPQFDAETAELMADAGCIAVTGGIEVASDRLLKLMNKGVTLAQVSLVTSNFSRAGIFVHAYLMYGFPTQTVEETIEALENVRKLFKKDSIQSAFWHRFSATIHSPVGKNPEQFGIKITGGMPGVGEAQVFAVNDLEFVDPTGVDHDRLGKVLNHALYNYMHGNLLDRPVLEWFCDHGIRPP
ncbi:MAG: radical SAM protein [Xanthomonadaceae bacterium]|nr:radical SAM protein [Xanthomonadaceae bacterium]